MVVIGDAFVGFGFMTGCLLMFVCGSFASFAIGYWGPDLFR
jgi:hypothetical protein